ncbi:MAG: hypothetical protein KAI71_00345 [Candidatus Pacebacteria bacterium]|nr:hypothetical protein [Candidatus Paceibacterota bacterium]
MLKKVMIATTILAVFAISMGCIGVAPMAQQDETATTTKTAPIAAETKLTEMENLQLFLKEDQTDKMNYDPYEQKGLNFLSGAKFVRALAENATEQGIPMGAIAPRNTQGVGRATTHSEPMSYAIINNKFIVIDPVNDQIYSLDELLGNCGRYISIIPDAQMMPSFGPRSRGIDIDLEGEYNEKQLVKEFKPITS